MNRTTGRLHLNDLQLHLMRHGAARARDVEFTFYRDSLSSRFSPRHSWHHKPERRRGEQLPVCENCLHHSFV